MKSSKPTFFVNISRHAPPHRSFGRTARQHASHHCCASLLKVVRSGRAAAQFRPYAADLMLFTLSYTRSLRPALVHAQNVLPVHRPVGQLPALVDDPKERFFLSPGDSGGHEVSVGVSFGLVVGRDLVALPSLLVQPDPPTLPALVVVLRMNRRGIVAQRRFL